MNPKHADLAPCGMAHLLGLKARLPHIDRDIAFPQEPFAVPKGDDIRISIDATKSSIQTLDSFWIREFQVQLDRRPHVFPCQNKLGQRRQILGVVLGSGDRGGFQEFK